MNVSLSSLSVVCHRANAVVCTLVRSFSSEKLFFSRSKTPFFVSRSSRLESFSLRDSVFDRFLASVVSIRLSSSSESRNFDYFVEKVTFKNAKSIYPGSALSCTHSSMIASVSLCSFINCSSTKLGDSSQRTNNKK